MRGQATRFRHPFLLFGLERGPRFDEISPGLVEFGRARLRFGPDALHLGLDAPRDAREALAQLLVPPGQSVEGLERGFLRCRRFGDLSSHGVGLLTLIWRGHEVDGRGPETAREKISFIESVRWRDRGLGPLSGHPGFQASASLALAASGGALREFRAK